MEYYILGLGPHPARALGRRTSCPPLRAGTGSNDQLVNYGTLGLEADLVQPAADILVLTGSSQSKSSNGSFASL